MPSIPSSAAFFFLQSKSKVSLQVTSMMVAILSWQTVVSRSVHWKSSLVVCPISNDGAFCLAWLLGAFSPQFTAGTVWLGSKALGEVVGSAGSTGCPGSAPDGYVRGLV